MWQVLAAAAIAGSGLFIKHLRDVKSPEPSQQIDANCDQSNISFSPTEKICSKPQFSTPPPPSEESIFRFSSASGSPSGKGYVGRDFRKKLGSGSRGIRGSVDGNAKNGGDEKFEKKCGSSKDRGEGMLVNQRKIGKKFAVCLKKKRRTGRSTSAKCESCAPKDGSSFALGLGAGLMYMMSAGKSEISRLNTAIDETAKVVQELKTEIAKRKSSRNLDVKSMRAEGNANTKKSRGKYSRAILYRSNTENTHDIRVDGFPASDEGECGSSVLTEEPQPEVLMDQLEAELESELQKLPWCTTEASGPERSSAFSETEFSVEEFNKLNGQNLMSHQHNGVMPSELDQKLCHVLLEQQEGQIVELESELQRSHSKLNEKEIELQALKDCIRRLTKVSLASLSDEESEAQEIEEEKIDMVHDSMGPDPKKSVVGTKRAMDYESYSHGCCTNDY